MSNDPEERRKKRGQPVPGVTHPLREYQADMQLYVCLYVPARPATMHGQDPLHSARPQNHLLSLLASFVAQLHNRPVQISTDSRLHPPPTPTHVCMSACLPVRLLKKAALATCLKARDRFCLRSQQGATHPSGWTSGSWASALGEVRGAPVGGPLSLCCSLMSPVLLELSVFLKKHALALLMRVASDRLLLGGIPSHAGAPLFGAGVLSEPALETEMAMAPLATERSKFHHCAQATCRRRSAPAMATWPGTR
jgi:hypothetical protein